MSSALSFSGRVRVIVADRAVDLDPDRAAQPWRCLRERPRRPCAAASRPIGASANKRRVHRLQLVGDDQREFRLGEDVASCRSTPGAISVSTTPSRRQLHDAALGDIGDVLALLDGAPAREGDVLDLVDQLLQLAFLLDHQLAVGDGELGAGIEHAGEDDLAWPAP